MLPQRGRAKKLAVAFHFQFANQAAWKCDTCRQQGLEKTRRCGFLPQEGRPNRPVWVRKHVSSEECPRSFVTAESETWLEEFHLWRFGGRPDLMAYPAKSAEAFTILESELMKEQDNGEPA